MATIVKNTKRKPKKLNGKTFFWSWNPETKRWVKFRR